MNTTIVSTFLQSDRTNTLLEQYIDFGIKLIDLKVPKVIFIDKEVYDTNEKIGKYKNDKYTHFVPIEKKDLYFYKYKEDITEFHLRNHDPIKDTLDYMMIICNKPEWVREAIEKNIFHSDQFIWIDFGIYKIFNNDELFKKCIMNSLSKSYETVRIATIWDVNNHNYGWNNTVVDLYKDIAWYFAGGVFGGHKDSLLKFAELMREKVISIIREKKHIMWEVNMWYLIYLDLIDKKLFNIYYGSHDPGILENY